MQAEGSGALPLGSIEIRGHMPTGVNIVPSGLGDYDTIAGTAFNFDQVFGNIDAYYYVDEAPGPSQVRLYWDGLQWVEKDSEPPHPVDLY